MLSQKSNEPTKTKKAMKQTMKYLSIAALVVVGANMMSCNKVELSTEQLQEDKTTSNVVTLTTTVGLDGGATTRALTAGGVKTFAESETMALIYKNTSGTTVKAVSAALADDGDITNEGKSAKFTFELTNPDRTKNVTYIYPAAMAKDNGDINYDALSEQDGILDNLASNLDLATYSGAWNSGSLPSGTLSNQLAILAITLKDADGTNTITSGLTQVTISDGTYSYAVAPTVSNFGSNVIYVAIHPTTTANIEVTATDGSTDYTKSLTGKTYAAGNGYNVSWRMAPAAKAAAEATAEDKGKLIGTDGNIYADVAAATAAGTTAVAKIIYLGTTGHATYTHGLALALNDEASTMLWQAAIDACSAKNTNTPVTDATWLLASKDQWDYMLGTNGAGSYTALRDGFSGITGASNLQSGNYWSSTKDNAFLASSYDFASGGWISTLMSYSYNVRACLAF